MGEYFDHDEIFPIIADCIRKKHRGKKVWVVHEEIVQCLMNDPEGAYLVRRAFRRWKSKPHKSQVLEWRTTPRGWAGNMVAWFGQKITEHMSSYEKEFELSEHKPYAYKPKRTE
jgi:hypothetical protein